MINICMYTVTCFKLTCVFFLFIVDSVIFSTPNNVIYHKYVGNNVTMICNVINYIEFHWQLSDNAVPILGTKYQYLVSELS